MSVGAQAPTARFPSQAAGHPPRRTGLGGQAAPPRSRRKRPKKSIVESVPQATDQDPQAKVPGRATPFRSQPLLAFHRPAGGRPACHDNPPRERIAENLLVHSRGPAPRTPASAKGALDRPPLGGASPQPPHQRLSAALDQPLPPALRGTPLRSASRTTRAPGGPPWAVAPGNRGWTALWCRQQVRFVVNLRARRGDGDGLGSKRGPGGAARCRESAGPYGSGIPGRLS